MNSKRWALISGASAGIGRATALALSQRGYSLILLGRRQDRLKELQSTLATESRIGLVDIAKKSAVDQFFQDHREALSQVEVLVNNAGLAKGTERLQEADVTDWDEMIDTNVKGLLYLTRGLLPQMIQKRQGHIVNLGSVAGRWVYPGGGVYCATKFAVRALSEGLRLDLQGTGIRVTNIEPGMVQTEFSKVRYSKLEGADDLAKAVYEGMTPLTAEDIAETIAWCVERPPHVNIQELVIFPTDQAGVGPNYIHRKSN
jgi:3-hydroxy acid dehydrogenase / malonic semialdehyde reductase